MQDQNPKDLEPFFSAAREKSHELPEHARRRILNEAEALQPKPSARASTSWRLPRLLPTLQIGAAMASLALGFFLGLSDPESIVAMASIDGLTEVTNESSADFLGGFSSMLLESETL